MTSIAVVVALTPVQLVQLLRGDREATPFTRPRRGVEVQERHADRRALARIRVDVVLVARDRPAVVHRDVPGPAVPEEVARDPARAPHERPVAEHERRHRPAEATCPPVGPVRLAALCAGRPPSAWWRARRSPQALRRRSLRRRLRLPPPVVTATAATAPFALCVLVPRSRKRDVAVLCLQMWAYVATYQMPNDDPDELERRVRIDYPVNVDRLIGGGTTPTLRLQRAFGTPGRINAGERADLVALDLVPRSRTAPRRSCCSATAISSRAARRCSTRRSTSALIGYWAVPTAPPWYAAAQGRMEDGRTPELRRMMVEYGEQFWKSNWDPLYGFLGRNPLAAMPSLHFATSVKAAHVLSETRAAVAGALGWTYAGTLGVALVYLGEHYVVDLAAGLALTRVVRRRTPPAAPAFAGRRHRAAAARGEGARVNTTQPRSSRPTRRRRRRRGTRSTRPGSTARHASSPASRSSSCSRSSRSTSCCPSSPAWRRPGTGSRTAARSGSGSRSCSRSGCSPATCCCSAASSARGRGPADAARELPDLHGRAGGDAAVRRRRRRRARADSVGAAPGRAARARGGRQDDLVPRPDLPRLHAALVVSAASGCASASSRARRRSR